MAKGSHYWRNLRCEGCSQRCRYRDFKVFDQNGFRETVESLWKDTEDSDEWVYKRRHTILGNMHETKRQLWEEMTSRCPHNEEIDELQRRELGEGE